ncbi:MAG: hypothetical protein IJT94_07835 [Oscillibacter sp.]|nr:hypothetical protein [Oscillibacter sp.]
MKKTLFLLVLLLFTLPASASAEYVLNSVLVNTDTDTLTASIQADSSCTLYVVLYDRNGRALGCASLDWARTKGLNVQKSLTGAFSRDLADAVRGRAFLLEPGSLFPLLPAYGNVTLLGSTKKTAALDLVDSTVTLHVNRDALADYIVAEYTALPSLLSAPFWDAEATDGAAVPADFPAYRNISTVLAAMQADTEEADGGGRGSVFDRYASQAYKDRVESFFRSASASGSIAGAGHGISVTPDRPVTVYCGQFPMKEKVWYAFAAVARGTAGGGTAFRAVYPMAKPDTEPQDLTDTQTTLRMDTETDSGGTVRTLDTFSGLVSLTFNEYLYALDPDAGWIPLDRGPLDAEDRDESRFRSIAALVQARSSPAVYADMDDAFTNRPVQVIAIRFDHAAGGEFLTFSADLCDRYGNTRNLPLTVRVRVEKVRTLDHLDENGTPVYALVPVPVVTVSPADWYGSG